MLLQISKLGQSYQGKIILRLMTLVLLTCIALGTTTPSARAEIIGISLPLSGDRAKHAKRFLAGAQIAMNVLGGNHELFVADDGCNPDFAELAADDLFAKGAVIITGFLCNETTKVIATRIRTSGIPLLVSASRSIRLIKDREREEWNLWRLAPGDDYPAIASSQALSSQWKNVAYAIVDDGTIYGRTLADTFRGLMEDESIPPQFVETFRPAQSTQASLVRRLNRSGIEAVFIAAATSDDIFTIAKNMAELDAKFEIVTTEAIASLPFLENVDEVEPGIRVVMPQPTNADFLHPQIKTAIEQADETPDAMFMQGIASIEVALQAINSSPEAVTEKLSKSAFQTILGPVQFDADGRNIQNPYKIYVWNGEEFITENEFELQRAKTQ